MKIKILNWILVIDILSILLILSIIFIPSTLARVILGLPFLLFFPGYTLVAALFAKKDGMDKIELVALSFGMSIAVVALIGFGLNYTPWGIRLGPVLYSITAFIFLTSVIALIRRYRISGTNKFTTEFKLRLPGWEGSLFNKSLSIILIIAVLGALGTLVYTVAVPKIGERFTEFYILGINGKAEDYPTEYIMDNGQVTKVTYSNGEIDSISGIGRVSVGIVNHEQQTLAYYVKMTIDDEPANIDFGGETFDVLKPNVLQQGEKWEEDIGIVPLHTGDNQKVELLLFKDAETTARYSLHIWIKVTTSEAK